MCSNSDIVHEWDVKKQNGCPLLNTKMIFFGYERIEESNEKTTKKYELQYITKNAGLHCKSFGKSELHDVEHHVLNVLTWKLACVVQYLNLSLEPKWNLSSV